MPQHVQQHRHDHAVGGVAVDAAKDAAGPPLVVGDALDRLEGVMDAGVGEDVEVQTRDEQQPELPEADRAEMVEGVHLVAESDVEDVLDAHEQPAQDLLQDLDHVDVSSGNWGSVCGWPFAATGDHLKNRPPWSGLKSITITWWGLRLIRSSLTKLNPGLTRLSFIRTAS
ncbi:MAG: hypothetical protein AW07_03293 [Candidatus Accumulibacter sp. SK-11]|nr:MAG: hypothetical protein AW07_03293 [Candidatus Accumulibacter sp. SK-11]